MRSRWHKRWSAFADFLLRDPAPNPEEVLRFAYQFIERVSGHGTSTNAQYSMKALEKVIEEKGLAGKG